MNLATTLTPSKPNKESQLRNDQSWFSSGNGNAGLTEHS